VTKKPPTRGVKKIDRTVKDFDTCVKIFDSGSSAGNPPRLTGIICKSPIASLLAVLPPDLVDFGIGVAILGTEARKEVMSGDKERDGIQRQRAVFVILS
jgi:hypothetical protein